MYLEDNEELKGSSTEQVSLGDITSLTGNSGVETAQADFKPLGASGFDALGGLLLSGISNSALTTAIVKNIKDVFKKYELEEKGFTIIPLDKEVYTSLAYSVVVVTKKYDGTNGKKYSPYFLMVLEGTGNKPMTAGSMMNEINTAIKLGKKPNIWMADLAVDNYLIKIVNQAVISKMGTDVSTYTLDGLVVPTHHVDTLEVLCEKLAIKAYDTVASNEAMATGLRSDIVLNKAIKDNTTIKAEITLNTNGVTYYNVLGKPVSTDAVVELVEVKNQNQAMNTLNVPDARFRLGAVKVKCEFIPEQVSKPVPGGTIVCMRLRPHIIITDIETSPTIGSLMLMIRAGALITQQSTWLALASNNKNLGAMNVITNIENDPSGQGQPYDFNRKDVSPEQIQDIIRKMVDNLEPILSIDVDKFGPITSQASILTQAALGDSNEKKMAASVALLNSLKSLTAGDFNPKFTMDRIFATAVGLPIGSYGSKTGERDIRDLDNTFVMASTKDVARATKATICKVEKRFTGADPMTSSVEFLATLVDEAEIVGRTYRITFNGEFIAELVASTARQGLNLTFDPLIKTNTGLSLDMLGSIYGAGALGANMGGLNMNQSGPNNTYYMPNYGYTRPY